MQDKMGKTRMDGCRKWGTSRKCTVPFPVYYCNESYTEGYERYVCTARMFILVDEVKHR